jgi:hypothetical protein
MGDWVEPLLYAAAEATALRDWALAARTLDAFSACVAHGAGLEARRPAPARARRRRPACAARTRC